MRIPPSHVPRTGGNPGWPAAIPVPRGGSTPRAGRRTRDSRGHAPAAASLPPPPARPSRIHGPIQRPRPRRAASPRASGAYSNPSPPARPPSPVLLSIAPSSSSLTTSTRAASGRPRPVCMSRLPNPLARASPSTSLLLLPKAPERAAFPPPASPYSGGRCSGSAAAAILNFRTPSLPPPPPLGGGGGRRGAGSEPRARGRERGGGSAPHPACEGGGGKGSGWESAGLDEVI
ncbi:nascent polypeptide-associated complex subunit alpha, muscle-specific form-like isoform X2 [Zonotrichia leucophrys gambelii]|uniref:nascent polypeptide-associated complex subunit alpha, muscle-specific form-like isoform X2 n=1 Tax=Zonotrichia leucophrys gambelii TaxID=257770 RepID=UPI003140974E